MAMNPIGPHTPTPNPPRPGSAGPFDDAAYQDPRPIDEAARLAYNLQPEEDLKYNPNIAGEPQTADPHPDDFEDPLLCKELLESCTSLTDGYGKGINHVTDGNLGGSYGLSELENLDFDTPPDLSLAAQQLMTWWMYSKEVAHQWEVRVQQLLHLHALIHDAIQDFVLDSYNSSR